MSDARFDQSWVANGGRMRIVEIGVAEDRYRRDLGDVDELAESIRRTGLLHPVVIDRTGRLVCGRRRLEACRVLGWEDVPVTIADSIESAVAALIAERDENECRKEMLMSEKVALGKAIEDLERPVAEQLRREGNARGGRARDEVTVPGSRDFRVREQVGEALGMSGATYQRAAAVVDRAERGDETAQEALAEMDATGKVRPAYDKVTAPATPKKHLSPPNTQRQKDLAHAAKKRVEVVVGQCQAFPVGLPGLRVEDAASVATSEEVAGWVSAVNDGIRALRAFHKQLKECGRVPEVEH